MKVRITRQGNKGVKRKEVKARVKEVKGLKIQRNEGVKKLGSKELNRPGCDKEVKGKESGVMKGLSGMERH